MRTFSGKRSTLALAIAGVTAMSGFMAMPEARAEGFIDDSTLTGGIYYWQRERDRKDVTDGDKYKTNLSHSTWNANLDFQSGYAADMFGLDIAAFTAIEMAENGDSSHPNEIAFSKSNKAYDEDWSGDKSGISLYKAAAKFKYGPVWARAGYIQPTGQTLLAPHWSFMPGTYQGAEAGANFDYGDAGALSSPTCGPTNTKRRGIWKWMSFIRTIKPPKLIICTPLGRNTTSKITSYWKRHLVRRKGISINILPKPATNLISPVAR